MKKLQHNKKHNKDILKMLKIFVIVAIALIPLSVATVTSSFAGIAPPNPVYRQVLSFTTNNNVLSWESHYQEELTYLSYTVYVAEGMLVWANFILANDVAIVQTLTTDTASVLLSDLQLASGYNTIFVRSNRVFSERVTQPGTIFSSCFGISDYNDIYFFVTGSWHFSI